ncbi:MAG: hypothetical protein HC924_14980 [Synechococcaceae cyanobacterium SM2_3_2]|nr:hypothetical protein [Synechococcaceae cyanobacterium SM2_3_2]
MFDLNFDAPELGKFVYAGEPRLYQADCRSPGSFRIMGVEGSDAKTLPMKILAYHSFEDELFGYDYQKWLEVLFIDKDNIVSSILLKTQSLSNFANFWLTLTQKGTGLSTGITTARLKKVSSRKNGTDYSTVTFFDNGDPAFQPLAQKDVEELKEFVVSHAQALSSAFRFTPQTQAEALPDGEKGSKVRKLRA